MAAAQKLYPYSVIEEIKRLSDIEVIGWHCWYGKWELPVDVTKPRGEQRAVRRLYADEITRAVEQATQLCLDEDRGGSRRASRRVAEDLVVGWIAERWNRQVAHWRAHRRYQFFPEPQVFTLFDRRLSAVLAEAIGEALPPPEWQAKVVKAEEARRQAEQHRKRLEEQEERERPELTIDV